MGERHGQHYLIDRRVIDGIIGKLAPRSDDRIVEIGPGKGALTLPLAPRCAALAAIEIDARLARAIAARLDAPLLDLGDLDSPRAGALREGGPFVIRADALELSYAALARYLGLDPGDRLRIVGNLPYGVATALVQRMVSERAWIADALVMVQSEVAERMVATPGTKAYGPLGVLLALTTEATKLFTIGPGAFAPRPKIRSTIVHLRFLAPEPIAFAREGAILEIVKSAFSERRKKAAGLLARKWARPRPEIEAMLLRAGASADARAEAITPASYVRLAAILAESAEGRKEPSAQL